MSANDLPLPELPELPADFDERSRVTRERLERGEQMTMEDIASALGLPVEFFAAAAAIYAALRYGQPVIVNPAHQAPPSSQFH